MNISRRGAFKKIGELALFPLIVRNKEQEPTIVECWGYLLIDKILYELQQYNTSSADIKRFMENIKVSPINYGLNLGKAIGFGSSFSSIVPHSFCAVKIPYPRTFNYNKLSILAQKIQQFIRETDNIFYLSLSKAEEDKFVSQLLTYYYAEESFDAVSLTPNHFI